jgi:periplasmic protein CpxP/Spy
VTPPLTAPTLPSDFQQPFLTKSKFQKEYTMPLSPDLRDAVAAELKRIGSTLNLSDDQKQKVQAFLTEAQEKVQEYRQQNPNATQADVIKRLSDNRAAIRQRVTSILTPDQLTKWDSEVAKARDFLGQKLAA